MNWFNDLCTSKTKDNDTMKTNPPVEMGQLVDVYNDEGVLRYISRVVGFSWHPKRPGWDVEIEARTKDGVYLITIDANHYYFCKHIGFFGGVV